MGKKLAVLFILTVGFLGGAYFGRNIIPKTIVEKKIEKNQDTAIERIEEEKKIGTLGNVLRYVDDNLGYQETILNYTVEIRKKNNLPFSKKTTNNLADLVKREVEVCPVQMKDYVLDITRIGLNSEYRSEIWQQLTKEEKSELVKEVFGYKTKEVLDETKNITKDTYNKLIETIKETLKNREEK